MQKRIDYGFKSKGKSGLVHIDFPQVAIPTSGANNIEFIFIS